MNVAYEIEKPHCLVETCEIQNIQISREITVTDETSTESVQYV